MFEFISNLPLFRFKSSGISSETLILITLLPFAQCFYALCHMPVVLFHFIFADPTAPIGACETASHLKLVCGAKDVGDHWFSDGWGVRLVWRTNIGGMVVYVTAWDSDEEHAMIPQIYIRSVLLVYLCVR